MYPFRHVLSLFETPFCGIGPFGTFFLINGLNDFFFGGHLLGIVHYGGAYTGICGEGNIWV